MKALPGEPGGSWGPRSGWGATMLARLTRQAVSKLSTRQGDGDLHCQTGEMRRQGRQAVEGLAEDWTRGSRADQGGETGSPGRTQRKDRGLGEDDVRGTGPAPDPAGGHPPWARILEGPALTLVPESSWWGQQGGARPPSSTCQTPSQVPGVRGLPTEAALSTLSAWAVLLLGAHQGLAVHARLLLRIRAALPLPWPGSPRGPPPFWVTLRAHWPGLLWWPGTTCRRRGRGFDLWSEKLLRAVEPPSCAPLLKATRPCSATGESPQ